VALTGREHFVWFSDAKDTNIAVIKGVMGLYDSVTASLSLALQQTLKERVTLV
jgi:cobyrinic acid a,c-diamide synthase